MRTLTRLALLLLVLLPARLLGQATPEGEYPGLETGKMWTFDNPPKEYWAQRYQFTPSGDWMNHVQLSALRYGNAAAGGGSRNALLATLARAVDVLPAPAALRSAGPVA